MIHIHPPEFSAGIAAHERFLARVQAFPSDWQRDEAVVMARRQTEEQLQALREMEAEDTAARTS